MDVAIINHLNHPVLATNHGEAYVHLHVGLLGTRLEIFVQGWKAFIFGNQRINLHIRGEEFEPKTYTSTPGALDSCFVAMHTLGETMEALQTHEVETTERSVAYTSAAGPIHSVYVRDPDLNLTEITVHPANNRT